MEHVKCSTGIPPSLDLKTAQYNCGDLARQTRTSWKWHRCL